MDTAAKGQTATQLDGTNGSKHLNSYRPAVLGKLLGKVINFLLSSFSRSRLSPHFTTKINRGDPSLLSNNHLNDNEFRAQKEEWFV